MTLRTLNEMTAAVLVRTRRRKARVPSTQHLQNQEAQGILRDQTMELRAPGEVGSRANDPNMENVNFVKYCHQKDKVRAEKETLDKLESLITWTRAASMEREWG